MNEQLLDELNKKDDDLKVLENNQKEGYVVVESSIDFSTEDSINDDLMENDSNDIHMDVFVRIIRYMFFVTGLISGFVSTGCIPFYFLVKDETQIVSIIIFILTSIVSTVFYILMTVFVEHRHALVFFVLWIFPYYSAVFSFAAIIENIAPLQFAMICCMQSCSIIVYSIVSPRMIDVWKSFYIMVSVGVLGWILGLFAFITEQDWVSATLLGVVMILTSVYMAFQIQFVNRYSLAEKDLIKAVIQFYADPLRYIINRLKK